MKEYIRVLVRFEEGQTVCICMRDNPKCKKHCTPDIVERDKMRDWQKTLKVDKYGKGGGN